jgi:hypothetical protein
VAGKLNVMIMMITIMMMTMIGITRLLGVVDLDKNHDNKDDDDIGRD